MERSAAVTAVNRVTSGKMFVLASVLSGADQQDGDMVGDSEIRVDHFRHHHTLHTYTLSLSLTPSPRRVPQHLSPP